MIPGIIDRFIKIVCYKLVNVTINTFTLVKVIINIVETIMVFLILLSPLKARFLPQSSGHYYAIFWGSRKSSQVLFSPRWKTKPRSKTVISRSILEFL